MRSFKTEGIVIRRRNFQESDRIITVLTRHYGKIQVKAIGVRKITSKRAAHIEPLNVSEFSLYKGKSTSLLTEIQTKEYFSQIKEDLAKVGFAYHICELLDGLCPENEPNEEVFNLTYHTLKRLSKEQDIVSIIHEFEVELLTNLGYFTTTYMHQKNFNSVSFIEQILERKLRTKKLISKII